MASAVDLRIAADFLEENGFGSAAGYLRDVMGGAFMTGSRAYGTPRENGMGAMVVASDIDVVTLMENLDDFQKLVKLADNDNGSHGSLRFGKLNLIVFHDAVEVGAWRRGTEELKTRKPVTKEEAIEVIDRHRAIAFAAVQESTALSQEEAFNDIPF